MSNYRTTSALFSAALIFLTHSASAALVVFDDRTAFEAISTGLALEDFNSITSDTGFAFADLTVGDLVLSSDGGASSFGEQALIDVAPYVAGGGGIDGTPMLNSRGLDAGQSITITLPGAFSAFGFDFDNYDRSLEGLDVVIDGLIVATIPSQSDVGFLGFVGTMGGAFSEVRFVSNSTDSNSSGGTFNGIDNVVWGDAIAVPEPSSLLLLGLGFAALCMRRAGLA